MDKAQEGRIMAKLQKIEHLLHQIAGRVPNPEVLSVEEFGKLMKQWDGGAGKRPSDYPT